MPIIYKKVEKVIATWDDVLAVMDNTPYRVCRVCGVSPRVVNQARHKGYYTESIARRIHDATLGRLVLTPYREWVKSNGDEHAGEGGDE